MLCPFCNAETKVVDSRLSKDSLRRRRECTKCQRRFTTYERIESTNLLIVKKDGTREQFNREKLMAGIIRACEKRKISHETISQLIDEVEQEIIEHREVPSKKLGDLVMKRLRKIDKVAYIRFASVYREFADIESFEKELQKLLRRK